MACKTQKEGLSSPQQPYFRASLWIGVFALPIRVKSNRLGALPRRWGRKPVSVKRSR